MQSTLEKIVHSIVQAIEVDFPEKKIALNLETNNHRRFIKSDLINTRLRDVFSTSNCIFHKFEKSGWEGRMVIDTENYIIVSITSMGNLLRIPKVKDRNVPHYMQSCLYVINQQVKSNEQISFIEFANQFPKEDYVDDFKCLFKNVEIDLEKYTYYVISYQDEYDKVIDVNLHLLDKYFKTIDIKSLNEYIKPDFATLTQINVASDPDINVEKDQEKAKDLLSAKKGMSLKLRKGKRESDA